MHFLILEQYISMHTYLTINCYYNFINFTRKYLIIFFKKYVLHKKNIKLFPCLKILGMYLVLLICCRTFEIRILFQEFKKFHKVTTFQNTFFMDRHGQQFQKHVVDLLEPVCSTTKQVDYLESCLGFSRNLRQKIYAFVYVCIFVYVCRGSTFYIF